jgi:hypothetical protein
MAPIISRRTIKPGFSRDSSLLPDDYEYRSPSKRKVRGQKKLRKVDFFIAGDDVGTDRLNSDFLRDQFDS